MIAKSTGSRITQSLPITQSSTQNAATTNTNCRLTIDVERSPANTTWTRVGCDCAGGVEVAECVASGSGAPDSSVTPKWSHTCRTHDMNR